jgi:hypothetical protein
LADSENSKKNLYKKWMNVLVNERMNECTQTDRQTNREGKREPEKQTFQAMLLEKLLLPNKKKRINEWFTE